MSLFWSQLKKKAYSKAQGSSASVSQPGKHDIAKCKLQVICKERQYIIAHWLHN